MQGTKVLETQNVNLSLTDDRLAAIRRLALEDLRPEDLYVRWAVVCNDQLDRDHERFSPDVLQGFARTLPGKALLVGHQHQSAPEGRFFEAWLEQAGDATNLLAGFYIVKTQQNEHLRRQIDGGVYKYVSVGFTCEDLLCDLCGKSIRGPECPHIPGRSYDGKTCTATWHGSAEAAEGSIVYLGSQRGAEIVKAAGARPTTDDPPGGEGRDALTRLKVKVAELEGLLELTERTLEQKERHIDTLEEQAQEGCILRQDLVGEIERLAGLVGEEEGTKALLDQCPDLPLHHLKSLRTRLDQKWDTLCPPRVAVATAAPPGLPLEEPQVRAYSLQPMPAEHA